jgi:hypothetical protein
MNAKTSIDVNNLNMNEEIEVENKCGIATYFSRRATGGIAGDVCIDPYGKAILDRKEVFAQAYRGNRAFVGIDGKGNHANFIINDTPTRIKLGFESVDGTQKQFVVTKEYIRELLDMRDIGAFAAKLKATIITFAEKLMLRELSTGCNELDKAQVIEQFLRP